MNKRAINPTDWLQGFGLNQAIEVVGGQRVLYLSGQASNGPEGEPLHAGDLVAQFRLAWDNLKATLTAADMTPEHVVRLNLFTTDMSAFMAAAEELVPIWVEDGCMPTCTLVEVSSLFEPELMIELEATAVA